MLLTVLIVLLIGYVIKHRRFFYVLFKTLPRDLKFFRRFSRLVFTVLFWTKNDETVPEVFTKLAKKHPGKIALYFEEEKWTYNQLEQFSNKIANYFKSKHYHKNDCIALLMENRPENVGIWLGLSKIGVVTALINTNLVSSPLLHSIKAGGCRGIIFGSNFRAAIKDIEDDIKDLQLYEFSDVNGAFNKEIESCYANSPKELKELSAKDKFLYIYTSGTTGFPKAAIIPHSRYMLASSAAQYLLNLNESDIIYNPLPLYHSAGAMLATGQSLLFGLSVVLKRKFSASNYFADCNKYNCTVGIYIGELCRYILAAHKPGTQVKHRLKKMYGNGLRPQIWEQFKNTFEIPEIYEFYGATEGNAQIINIDGKVGAVGFIPTLARWLIPSVIIKCDLATGEPIRNSQGLLERCAFGEPGLMIGKINQKHLHKAFQGYADKKATEKKILKDVLSKGDMYFNTGDIVVEDEFGYVYFKDRTGDTFRWKGENVATSEVEAVLTEFIGYNDHTVYGVEIPHTEGRAGMAAIVDSDNNIDIKSLAKNLKSKLPSYAVPVFIRKMSSLPVTGTHKSKKFELQEEGFNLDMVGEGRVFVLDSKTGEYVVLTRELYGDILEGRLRL